MPRISPDEAADIAARHGLSLQDAAGLLSLADDAADAERIAARFAAADPERAVVQALFSPQAEPERYVGNLHRALDDATNERSDQQ
jgi:hypothetical protein